MSYRTIFPPPPNLLGTGNILHLLRLRRSSTLYRCSSVRLLNLNFARQIGMLFNHVLGHNHAFFARKVFRLLDLRSSQVDEDQDSRSIERKDCSGFFDVGHGYAVNTEADGFAGCEEGAVYTLVARSVSESERFAKERKEGVLFANLQRKQQTCVASS